MAETVVTVLSAQRCIMRLLRRLAKTVYHLNMSYKYEERNEMRKIYQDEVINNKKDLPHHCGTGS